MKLTLAVLVALLTIYCKRTVLSLPPSLIANAASLRQRLPGQLVKPEDALASALLADWNSPSKKDAHFQYSQSPATTMADLFDNIARTQSHTNPNTNINEQNKNKLLHPLLGSKSGAASASAAKTAHLRGNELGRKLASEYDLGALLAPPVDAKLLGPRVRDVELGEFLTPLKYWARHCQPRQDGNCPQEYYRALLADSHKTADVLQMNHAEDDGAADSAEDAEADDDYVAVAGGRDIIEDNDNDGVNGADDFSDNEIFMLLTGEQDMIKFLHWAMEQLYPYQKFANLTGNGAEYYHPGMFIWKKLNLSGRLEPPLIVDEPHYIIVRREPSQEDLQTGTKYVDDPFIPPRGRKHNMPDLDALMRRYDTFVPNRGKRDKIKDIFKYDDLFYPNRGKKSKPPATQEVGATATKTTTDDNSDGKKRANSNSSKEEERQADNNNNYADENKADDKLTARPLLVNVRHLLRQVKRKLRQQTKNCWPHVACNNKDSTNKWPTRMSTNEINGYDQSVMESMPTTEELSAPGAIRNAPQQPRPMRLFGGIGAAKFVANRLHGTRSMSAVPQSQLYRRLQKTQQLPYNGRQQPPTTYPRPIQHFEAHPSAHQVKSLSNLDPSLWRHLQLPQQPRLTMPQALELQPHQRPRETQLNAAAFTDGELEPDAFSTDDDIDYSYFNV